MSSQVSLKGSPFRISALGLQSKAQRENVIGSAGSQVCLPYQCHYNLQHISPALLSIKGRAGGYGHKEPCLQTFQSKTSSLLLVRVHLSRIQLCWRRAQLRCSSGTKGRRPCSRAEGEQFDFTLGAAAQDASHPNKQQDFAQDARKLKVLICGHFIVSPVLGNPSLIKIGLWIRLLCLHYWTQYLLVPGSQWKQV